jgi:hypothetical protein
MYNHDHEYLSECCGAPEGLSGLCPQCRDHSCFSCECGMTRLSKHDTIWNNKAGEKVDE